MVVALVKDRTKEIMSIEKIDVSLMRCGCGSKDVATYCVVDLSGGPNASSYPVEYMDAEPDGGFNTPEYKTTKLVLKRVDAGSFVMEHSEESDNQPHSVVLTKPFYMGIFEVTQKQWERVMGTRPSKFSGEANPVECVSYFKICGPRDCDKWPASDVVDYNSFLGHLMLKTGLNFRLPTEAQWEYVCRAGTTTRYSYGDIVDGDYMWFDGNSGNRTHEVGTRKPNRWGFYDMHGNVWEWCRDWYGKLSMGTDPRGSSSGSDRVRRGGSWYNYACSCASSYRSNSSPSDSGNALGFRLSVTFPYRQEARYHTCISNQASILSASKDWFSNGNRHIAPRLSDLTDCKRYFINDPVCPSGGTYSIFFSEDDRLTVSCSKHVYGNE